MTLRLFLLEPDTIFAARVNQGSFSYPLTSVEFDGVTTGAFGDILPGMTVVFGSTAGADDYGRQRIRLDADSDTIFVGRSSQGTRDGEVNLADNAYITVLNDFRIWAKIPYIDSAGESFKDEIDWSDETVEPPPVANCGPAVFATIAAGIITVDFDAGNSFVVADGAAIATYAWDVDDGSITVGTAASQAITATFPSGFRWVSLTITDDNGKSHTARTPVFARNPAAGADKTISIFEITQHRITQDGQDVSVRIRENIAETTYPDGTLCMIADGEPSIAADRTNLLSVGWHWADPATISAKRTGVLRDTVFQILDVAGRLGTLPTFGEEVTYLATPDSWATMTTPNIDKFMHYLFQWHSTALDLADWTPSGTGSAMATAIFQAEGQSLWDAIARKGPYIVPDYHLTCNTLGQLQTIVDPFLQDSGDRTATIQATLTEDDWSDVKYTHQHFSRFHWLRAGAVVTGTTDPENLPTVFGIAPGPTPSQGANETQHFEQLAVSQAALNKSAGHRYARMNAPETSFRIELAQGSDQGIEPADMTWVRLTISAATAAQRGLAFTEERGLPLEVNINYNHARTGLIRRVTLVWERETVGLPAITYVPFEDGDPPDDDNWWDDVYVDPVVTNYFPGNMGWYVMWDGLRVVRSKDFSEASPTWELIDSGLTGVIGRMYDIQYIHDTVAGVVKAWALTDLGMYYCADIMATTPTWTAKLTNATVQSTEDQPPVGATICVSFGTWDDDPDFIFVATGFDKDAAASVSNNAFEGGELWHSHDNGDTWTHIDISSFTFENSAVVRSYMITDLYATEIYRDSDGIIYNIRGTRPVFSHNSMAVFKSADSGHTWALAAQTYDYYQNYRTMALQHPFPDRTSDCYLAVGPIGVTTRPNLYKSTDEFENTLVILEEESPVGVGGVQQGMRVNNRPDNDLHCLVWTRDSVGSPYEDKLYSTIDGGSSWVLLWNTGETGAGVTYPSATQSSSLWSTPNGWPSDGTEWVCVRRDASLGAVSDCVRHTADYFATTPVDKTGNLESVLGAGNYSDGSAGGFALPKIGGNV